MQSPNSLAIVLNVVVFVVVTWLAFMRQPYGYFEGIEGNQARLLIEQQSVWFPFTPGMQIDEVVGPGASNFAVNSQMIPVARLAVWLGGLPLNTTLLYVLLAAELFGAVYALGRTLGLGPVVSPVGAWVCCLYVLPYYGFSPLIATVGHVVPYFADTTAGAAFFIVLFHRLGRGPLAATCLRIGGLLAVEFVAVAGYPGVSLVALPVIFIYMGVSYWLAATRSERRAKLAAAACLTLVAIGSGEASYVLATGLYVDSLFFNSEMYNAQALSVFASIFFHSYSYSAFGPALVMGSLLGAQRRALVGRGETSRLAMVNVIVTIGLLAVGLLVHRSGSTYTGPKILYFEYALIPFYALFAADLLVHVTRWALARLRAPRYSVASDDAAAWAGPSLIALAIGSTIFLYPPRMMPPFAVAQPSPLTDYLSREIAARPGVPFRGRVATFSGVGANVSGLHWVWSDLDILDLEHWVHNEHRFAGLWSFDIPTLQENSEWTSPAVYLVASRLLSRPQDVQTRNFIWLTRPDLPTLRLFGVRFILWDQADLPGTQVRAVMHYGAHDERTLKVLEISGANINGYSPTQAVPIASAGEAIEALSRGGFDPAHQVMLSQANVSALAAPLIEARNPEIVPERGYIRVRAEAPGASLVVIPYEYSHCMRAVAENGTAAPRLWRANLVNTAIGFEGRLDIRLKFRFGPFWPNTCRFRDLADFRKLRLRDVPLRR